MKIKGLILVVTMFFVGTNLFAKEKVVEEKNGWFWAFYNTTGAGRFTYAVDSITQNCFLIAEGAVKISCEELAKRDEWKPIITWVR